MHAQSGCSGNDSHVVVPSLPCSDSQPADSPRFLMAGLGTKYRVWFQIQSLVPMVGTRCRVVLLQVLFAASYFSLTGARSLQMNKLVCCK